MALPENLLRSLFCGRSFVQRTSDLIQIISLPLQFGKEWGKLIDNDDRLVPQKCKQKISLIFCAGLLKLALKKSQFFGGKTQCDRLVSSAIYRHEKQPPLGFGVPQHPDEAPPCGGVWLAKPVPRY